MFERFFAPRTKAGAILRIAFWTIFVSLVAISLSQFVYRIFFPGVWEQHGSRLAYFIFGIASIIAIPVLTTLFMVSLRLSRLNAQLHDFARRDGLTGLLNRIAFEELIRRRKTEPLLPGQFDDALLVIDVDHFKNINDSHGHSAGDHVLKMVSVCIAGNVFERDYIARIGGEEFAVFLLNSGAHGAAAAAERIRSALEDNKAHFEGETIRITASVGSALFPRGATYSTIYRSADNALYRAKSAGRNCCHFNGLPASASDLGLPLNGPVDPYSGDSDDAAISRTRSTSR